MQSNFDPGKKAIFFIRKIVCVLIVITLIKAKLAVSALAKDAWDRKAKRFLPVQRIVVLNSDVLEVVRSLGAEKKVVGVFSEVVRESEFWGSLAQKPKVGSWRDANIEAIVALNPDIVLAYKRNPGPELEKKLSVFSIQVLRLDFYKIGTMEQEITILGRLIGQEQEARRLCNWYRERLRYVKDRLVKSSKHPRVYVESYTNYHTVASGSGGHEMCILAGGENIASNFSVPYPRITPEWVVGQNPDVIVKAIAQINQYGLNTFKPFNEQRNIIMNRPGWRNIKAVQTGRVHVIGSSIWAGPRAVVGIAHMARWFYPEIFRDLKPESWHKEYLETFQKIPYKGVYVSHPEKGKL